MQVAMKLTRDHVDAALAKDAGAIRILVSKLTPVIQVRVARALLRRRSEAAGRDLRQESQDMIQEVFAAIFTGNGRVLRAWDPQRGLSLENFVGLVAERQVASILRSHRRSPWSELPADEIDMNGLDPESPYASDARIESRDQLRVLCERMRDRLSPLGLQLFERLVVAERSVEGVSAEMNMTTDALYQWRSRLLKLTRALAAEMNAEMGAELGAGISAGITGGMTSTAAAAASATSGHAHRRHGA